MSQELSRCHEEINDKSQRTQNPRDTRYDLPREKIKDTGSAGQIFIPKRLHEDSTHKQNETISRLGGPSSLPNLRYIYIYKYWTIIYIYIYMDICIHIATWCKLSWKPTLREPSFLLPNLISYWGQPHSPHADLTHPQSSVSAGASEPGVQATTPEPLNLPCRFIHIHKTPPTI
jgi:hypothetical protein